MVEQALEDGPRPPGEIGVFGKGAHAPDQVLVPVHEEQRQVEFVGARDEVVPVPLQIPVERPPVGRDGLRIRPGRRRMLLRRGARPGMVLVVRRRDGVDVPGRRRGMIGRRRPCRVPRHRFGVPGRLGAAALQRKPALPPLGDRRRFRHWLFHLPR